MCRGWRGWWQVRIRLYEKGIQKHIPTLSRLEHAHRFRSRIPQNAKTTICKRVPGLRLPFFRSRLFFSSQERLRLPLTTPEYLKLVQSVAFGNPCLRHNQSPHRQRKRLVRINTVSKAICPTIANTPNFSYIQVNKVV